MVYSVKVTIFLVSTPVLNLCRNSKIRSVIMINYVEHELNGTINIRASHSYNGMRFKNNAYTSVNDNDKIR